ncbi:MAG: hypothetical protein JO232_20505 [Verrucomicrobia bacterium]|nr:hypothetical protein [Verrucomicrobiota bacterium]
MNFERNEILIPILDHLGVDDDNRFRSIQQKILAQLATTGQHLGTSAVSLMFQALRDELTTRATEIFSEIRRVLAGSYIEDFDNLAQALKEHWFERLNLCAGVAAPHLIRMQNPQAGVPSEAALFEHVARLKEKWFAEIELFCRQLHDSQTPRLFLKAGEVFAGNRAARAVFAAAQQALDVIDTYFGPRVFDILEVCTTTVRIRLISNRADKATRLSYTLFNQEFNNRAEFRLCDPASDKLHDRFIIVDGRQALHFGSSIKDLGKSDSLIDSAQLEPHKQRVEELWLRARPVTSSQDPDAGGNQLR